MIFYKANGGKDESARDHIARVQLITNNSVNTRLSEVQENKCVYQFATNQLKKGHIGRHTKMQQRMCPKVIIAEVYSSTIKLSEMKTKKQYVREALARVERLNRKKKKKTKLSLFEKFNSGGYFIRLIKQNRDEKL